MKKILILIATASLLFACDKTTNEQDIMDTFFGNGTTGNNSPSPEVYSQMQPTQNVYLDDFSNPATSVWAAGNDNYSLRGFENGELIIQGKQNFYIWQDIPNLNQSLDFQIEIRAQLNFAAADAASYMGIVWGVTDEPKTFNYIALSKTGSLQIGNFTSNGYDNWYIYASDLSPNVHHVYTIRKVGKTMYFFTDETYVYKTEYKAFLSNYGFWLTTGGIVSADYARVDYIEMVKNK